MRRLRYVSPPLLLALSLLLFPLLGLSSAWAIRACESSFDRGDFIQTFSEVVVAPGTRRLCGVGAAEKLVPLDREPASHADHFGIAARAAVKQDEWTVACVDLERPLEAGVYQAFEQDLSLASGTRPTTRVVVREDADTSVAPPRLVEEEREIHACADYGLFIFRPASEEPPRLYTWVIRDGAGRVVGTSVGSIPHLFGIHENSGEEALYEPGETYEVTVYGLNADGTRTDPANFDVAFRYFEDYGGLLILGAIVATFAGVLAAVAGLMWLLARFSGLGLGWWAVPLAIIDVGWALASFFWPVEWEWLEISDLSTAHVILTLSTYAIVTVPTHLLVVRRLARDWKLRVQLPVASFSAMIGPLLAVLAFTVALW